MGKLIVCQKRNFHAGDRISIMRYYDNFIKFYASPFHNKRVESIIIMDEIGWFYIFVRIKDFASLPRNQQV